jgi:hypothetical protein
MIKPFEYLESIDPGSFNENTLPFSLANNPTAKITLLRGITGSLRLKHTISQIEFDQNIDYLDPNFENQGQDIFERLRLYISEDISSEELGSLFKERRFLFQNQQFFERLSNEFNNFYYYNHKGSHTTAFAYIYRILETISYAFPLIYSSKTSDFKGTYNFLKDCFSGNKDKGELGFFKSFIKVVFGNDPAEELSITIPILGNNEEIQKSFFDAFKKACPDEEIYDLTDEDEPRTISVKFTHFSSFIICLRNRFFHLLNSGQPNLQSDDILDADLFFQMVNKGSIYWLSVVLIEILKHNIDISNE